MVTPLQQRVYDFIKEQMAHQGYSPSLVEIAKGIGISPTSISLISRSIHALVDAKRLKFHKSGYRNIQVVEAPSFSLPLLGRVAAGTPIEAISQEERIDLAALTKPDQFMLEVKGDSMIEEGIFEKDLVICKRADTAREGEIVVALIDENEATLKRVSYQIKDRITLMPANQHLKPKAYLPHRVKIQGVFLGLLRWNR